MSGKTKEFWLVEELPVAVPAREVVRFICAPSLVKELTAWERAFFDGLLKLVNRIDTGDASQEFLGTFYVQLSFRQWRSLIGIADRLKWRGPLVATQVYVPRNIEPDAPASRERLAKDDAEEYRQALAEAVRTLH